MTGGSSALPFSDFGRAPGKLILSGEHAVVYGAPAIALAVEKFTDVWFIPGLSSRGLHTAFESLSAGAFYPIERIFQFKSALDKRFDQFMRGELTVRQILERPDDLAAYTFTALALFFRESQAKPSQSFPLSGQLTGRSDLPIGAGMGSSASVIAATILLYEHLSGCALDIHERFRQVRFCERLQHGRGSAIDAGTVVYGGINFVRGDDLEPIELPRHSELRSGQGWYWALLGRPEATTGECVAVVREKWGADQALWQAFEDCTEAMRTAVTTCQDPTEIIRANHALLARVGVVPGRTQALIADIEQAGGAAKISGAGSVRGAHSGAAIVYMPDPESMSALMTTKYQDIAWGPVNISKSGARVQPASEAVARDLNT
ncbi:MAG: GHMP kinase [Pseudomonadota bacterium]